MSLACIIVDDEELCIQRLEKEVKKIPFLTLSASFSDPYEAMRYLEDKPVELVFLDIEMPNLPVDGLDFMKIMGDQYAYILTTGHPEYALESYEYNVLDFLHKPFSFERFTRAVQKARQHIKPRKESARPADQLFIKTKGTDQRILFDQICYVEADRNYVNIYRADDMIPVKMTFNSLEEQLPENAFFRVHKSYIAALSKVELIKAGQVGISRGSDIQFIPVSNQYKKTLVELLRNKSNG